MIVAHQFISVTRCSGVAWRALRLATACNIDDSDHLDIHRLRNPSNLIPFFFSLQTKGPKIAKKRAKSMRSPWKIGVPPLLYPWIEASFLIIPESLISSR